MTSKMRGTWAVKLIEVMKVKVCSIDGKVVDMVQT